MEVLQCYHERHFFFVTKSSNLFYSVKLGSVEVPCGGLELLKWGKTALGKKLEESSLMRSSSMHHKVWRLCEGF